MANHKSAAKRAIVSEKKRLVNKSKLTRLRTMVKKADVALKTGGDGAKKAVLTAESSLAKAGKKGLISKKAASRKTSRLTLKLRPKTAGKA